MPRRRCPRTSPRRRRRLRMLLTVAGIVLVADIVTKVLAVRLLTPGQPVPIIGDTVTWTLVRNSGAAFSMATGYTWVLTLIATGGGVRHHLDGPPAGVAVVGDRSRHDPRRGDGKPGRPVLPVARPAAGPRRGLPVHRMVAGVQRGRPVGGGRSDPARRAVAVRLRLRHGRASHGRRRFGHGSGSGGDGGGDGGRG